MTPIVLVVIDEITHNSAPFSETPEVAWTPFLGEVIASISEAEPAVIGLDMIFPKSIAGRNLAPGYDRTFLQALAAAGRSGKLVLAEARLSETPIRPYKGQEIAVGGAKNISPIHLTPDADNIVRRHPVFLPLDDGSNVRSFAAELSARAGIAPEDNILIDYVTPVSNFPTYRFADLYHCLQRSENEAFDIFRDKIVVIGTALDIEDRHVAANRFQRHKDPDILDFGCGVQHRDAGRTIARASTAGVFVEARAAYTFLNSTAPQPLGRISVLLTTLIFLATLSFVFFRLGPVLGFLLFIGAAAALWIVSAVSLAGGVLLPALPWLLVSFALYVVLYGYRVILEDQSKRWVTHAFEHYLNPALVNQLTENPDDLKLGGERRRVAVLFADLAGFTTTSEEMADEPEALVAHLNRFFEVMASNIELHDGYIDKFIGDAVMGVWGAPVELAAPEEAAVTAAIACAKAVEAHNQSAAMSIKMRIGISAGEVIAGNLGSEDRFNYTVIGDAVNRAARLEQENKRLGTQILFDGSIADHLPKTIATRFLEEIQLRGQTSVTRVYSLDSEN